MDQSPVILTLKINNSQPIALAAFVKAFTSLAGEYEESIKTDINFENENAEIFVKEIRAGSIIADLIPMAAPALPIIISEAERVFQAVEFVNKWGKRINNLSKGILPEKFNKSDLNRWCGTVEAIANDPKSSATLEAATFEDGERKVKASFTFASKEANKIEDILEGEFVRLEDKKTDDRNRVFMVFTRSDVGDAPVGKRSGERVLISEISEKALAITYGSEIAEDRIKHEIRESDENIYKKGFNVDVRVQLVGERPVASSILSVHSVVDLPD